MRGSSSGVTVVRRRINTMHSVGSTETVLCGCYDRMSSLSVVTTECHLLWCSTDAVLCGTGRAASVYARSVLYVPSMYCTVRTVL